MVNYGMRLSPDGKPDLIVTPDFGGSPEPRNLWPEPYGFRVWNARVKDELESLLPQLVCEGKVDLATGQDEVGPFIEVCDSGPGIPLEDRERVFDRFYRRGQAGGPGSGLGLAIVKTIADRHQARVVLDDSRLGGLRARVEFPPAVPP